MYKLIKDKFRIKEQGLELVLKMKEDEQNEIIKKINRDFNLTKPIKLFEEIHDNNLLNVNINEYDKTFELIKKEKNDATGYIHLLKKNNDIVIKSIYVYDKNININVIRDYKNINLDILQTINAYYIEENDIHDYDIKDGDDIDFYIPLIRSDIYESYKENDIKNIYESLNFGLIGVMILLVLILIFK